VPRTRDTTKEKKRKNKPAARARAPKTEKSEPDITPTPELPPEAAPASAVTVSSTVVPVHTRLVQSMDLEFR